MIPLIPPTIAFIMLLQFFFGFFSMAFAFGQYGVRWGRWFFLVLLFNVLAYLIYCASRLGPEVFNALGY